MLNGLPFCSVVRCEGVLFSCEGTGGMLDGASAARVLYCRDDDASPITLYDMNLSCSVSVLLSEEWHSVCGAEKQAPDAVRPAEPSIVSISPKDSTSVTRNQHYRQQYVPCH